MRLSRLNALRSFTVYFHCSLDVAMYSLDFFFALLSNVEMLASEEIVIS